MSGMVTVAVAGDITEAEEMQAILRNSGIGSTIERAPDDDAVSLMVAEGDLDDARDAIEALTDPDDLSADL